MNAGGKLDVLVGEKIFGVPADAERFRTRYGYKIVPGAPWGLKWVDVPPFSTDIAAAWEVVEKVGALWRGFHFGLRVSWYDPDGWEAGWYEDGNEGPEGRATAQASTPAHAICLAALQAVGE